MSRRVRVVLAVLGGIVLVVGGLGAWTFLRGRPAVNADGSGLMLDGFDPVSYFPEGGGAPQRGLPALAVTREGRRYVFASEKHRDLFVAAPSRYEPQFGGWCAYAVAHGYKFEVDPESYLVEEDRLFLFYRGLLGDARTEFEKEGRADGIKRADGNWPALR